FEQSPREALLVERRRIPYHAGQQPGAGVDQHDRRRLAARQHDVAEADLFQAFSLDDPLVDAFETPAQEAHARSRPSPATPPLTSGRAGRRRLVPGPGADVPSIAAATISGRITMPGPPPKVPSSTERCLSRAKSRMSTVSSRHTPSRNALPASEWPSGPGNISGKMVNTVALQRSDMARLA